MKKQNSFLTFIAGLLAGVLAMGAVSYMTKSDSNTADTKPSTNSSVEDSSSSSDEPVGTFAFSVEDDVTLTIGNDYSSSTASDATYASIQPYGIDLSMETTLVPNTGYAFKLYSLTDTSKPTTNTVVTTDWVTTAYTITEAKKYGVAIKKTDGSTFDLSTDSVYASDYLTAYDSGSLNVSDFEFVDITLTHGNDYNGAFVDNKARASIQPYGITIPSGVTLTAKTGYQFGFYSISDISAPLTASMLSGGWIDTYTTTSSGTYGISIKKTDDSEFDFSTDSIYVKDYFTLSVGAVEVLDVWSVESTHYSKWEGKKAIFIGDSITYGVGTSAGNRYWELLGEKLGFDEVVGYGVAGSCLSTTSNYGTNNSPIVNRWETIANANPDADLVFIFAGTNDYGHLTPIGQSTDSMDVSFYGALNIILSGLKEKLPNATIVYMTPLHRYGFGGFTYDYIDTSAGANLEDYVNTIKDACSKYSIPVIDGFNIPNFNPSNATVKAAYFPDGLHPNEKGHAYLVNKIARQVNDLK